tara:strand:- start:14927 stop:16465 length:1539 start_codon:yes stop_codon:yes gene_type:complete
MQLFGFEIKKKVEEPEAISFAPKQEDDGAMVVQAGGIYGTYVDMDGSIRTETELVTRYREMATHAEIEQAVDDIINEAIVGSSEEEPISLVLDDLDQSDKIKNLIQEEFDNILALLEFNDHSFEIFKKWYVDGRLNYHVIIDGENVRDGIKELRYIDPRNIRKVREHKKKKTERGVPIVQQGNEYYIYNPKGFVKAPGATGTNTQGIKIAKDSIVNITSGMVNPQGDLVLSYLHKAIKPLNQLKSMEDSLVIYRISRAPERRIFYIDVGNLPKMKAEQYLRDIMTRFKNKTVYNADTGEIRDDRKFMTMLEDFWLPRREGGKGTEISTLPGGQNLGQIDDIVYFQRKLNRSLNVPISRLEPDAVYNMGRSAEISRDEIKFSKFIDRLRMKFSQVFTKLLQRQLILKGIVTLEEWPEFARAIRFQYAVDNYYAELKDTEILRDRVSMLRDVDDYVGKYYSNEWVRTQVLRQTEEQIKDIDKQIKDELESGVIENDDEAQAQQTDSSNPSVRAR